MYSQITSNKRQSVILITLFIAIIITLGYVFDMATGTGNYSGIFFALILSFGMTLISYFQGDAIALFSTGAKETSKEESPYIYRMIENLCITSGLPMPKVYIIDDPAINAFATGRKPETASVAVTTGAIEKLTNEELEGVLAHEMSHIQNYDIRFMTLVAVLVGSISIITNIFLRSHWLPRRNDRENGNLGAIFMIIGIVLVTVLDIDKTVIS
jgi:heat shock protein HtpX